MQEPLTIDQLNKKSVLHSQNSFTYMQIGQLQKDLTELIRHNRNKFQEILKKNSNFQYKLYKINEFQAVSKAFGKQLLLRQMDRLLEEKNILDKELQLIGFREEEKTNEKEDMVAALEANHFSILKKVWNRSKDTYQNALDHAEDLNNAIGLIKGSIINITRLEKATSKENQDNYLEAFLKKYHTSHQDCSSCQKLQSTNQQLRAKLNLTELKLCQLNEENSRFLQEIFVKDEQIKKINKCIATIESQHKNKINALQEKLLLQDHEVKNLKKFKNELEKYLFTNNEEGYQLYLKPGPGQLLFDLEKQLTLTFQEVIEFLSEKTASSESYNIICSEQIQQTSEEVIISDFDSEVNIPVLALPKDEKQVKSNQRLSSERPRTERLKNQFSNNLLKLQQMDLTSKKYIRTNLLTTKRSSRMISLVEGNQIIKSKETVKKTDSPKNYQDSIQIDHN